MAISRFQPQNSFPALSRVAGLGLNRILRRPNGAPASYQDNPSRNPNHLPNQLPELICSLLRSPLLGLLALLLVVVGTIPKAQAQDQYVSPPQPRLPLFSNAPPPSWLEDDDSAALPAFSLRKFNPYLANLVGLFNPDSPHRFSAQLDSATQINITIKQEFITGLTRFTWIGAVDGEPDSLVILSFSQGSAAGTILIPGKATYRIENSVGYWHRVGSLDPTKPYHCQSGKAALTEVPQQPMAAPTPFSTAIKTLPAPADLPTTSVVDLLVIYNEAAEKGAGGRTAIQALIDTAVAEVNTVLANSGINARVNLVHEAEIDFLETGDTEHDLHELSDHDPDDETYGAIHDIQEMRQKYRADVVCLIAENTGDTLGIANLMTDLDVRFGKHAYCIIQRATANAYFAMAHEIGHLMGCQHDRENSLGPGLFPFSHAHRMTIDGVRYHTVMSYQPGLPIPYYSNPDVLFRNVPTGIPDSETNSANNAATIMASVPTVALFDRVLRPSQPPVAKLISPAAGSRFPAYATVELVAEVTDPDGQVDEVEFYVNGRKIWTTAQPPYSCTWTNTGAGAFAVRVEAEDNTGIEVYSPYVTLLFTNSAPQIDAAGCSLLSHSAFTLKVLGNPGQDYLIERSSDLIHWTAWMTNQFTNFVQWMDDDGIEKDGNDLDEKGDTLKARSNGRGTFYRIQEWFPPSPY